MTNLYDIDFERAKRDFQRLKEEMLGESMNGMKQIARDWQDKIFPEYKYFKQDLNYLEFPTHEAFYSALLTADIDLNFSIDDLRWRKDT